MDVHNLSFSHRKGQLFIKEMNLSVRQGAITTIVGPNGSGKSTLLSLLANELSPRQGKVTLNGKQLMRYSPRELARFIAVVYQQNEAPVDMTVRKLVAYGRYPHQRRFIGWTDKDEQAVTEALEATRLVDKAERPLHALSGGERQRVWLALALAQQTDVLLLDEPTTYLDLYNQYETLMLVRSLNQTYQKTIVMVLHDLNQALQYSDEIIVMKHGAVVAAGDPRNIMTESLVKEVFQVRSVIREDADAGLLFMPIGV